MDYYGIGNVSDRAYAAATALTYWVFKCRDRAKSPAMGTKTWTFLESSIQNAAEVSPNLEGYLQKLCNALIAHLRPQVLADIVQPEQRIVRVNSLGEIQEMDTDQTLRFMGWRDLVLDIAQDGFTEWDILELCRTRASIIQVLCRLRFEEDRALGNDSVLEDTETIDVEVANV